MFILASAKEEKSQYYPYLHLMEMHGQSLQSCCEAGGSVAESKPEAVSDEVLLQAPAADAPAHLNDD